MATIETKVLKTIEEIRIFSDPYRMKIMNQFHKAERPSTIKQIADLMGEVPAKVYYHARKLESIGLLELIETKLINGITAKYYIAFEGSVHINRDDVDESIKTMFASESQKLVARLFDDSKKKYMQNQVSDKTRVGTLINSDLYMTPEEEAELVEYLMQFVSKHGKRTRPEQMGYNFFYSLSNSEE
ncbi:winged helix-turn-helix domain-containing protein [Paenibacillus herberti]|nr:helix-turn-helix domain-containing protein [Paenibacillus herberti]